MYKKITKKVFVGEDVDPFSKTVNPIYEEKQSEEWVAPDVKKVQFATNTRAIISGNVIEFFTYEEPIFYGFESKTSNGKNKISSSDEKRSDSLFRTKVNIRRLINSNSNPASKFTTFTYSENLHDVAQCKNDFKKFIKRLNYFLTKQGRPKVSYLYVIEFQKRGALHFHCVFFNLGYIKKVDLQNLWKHGFVKINKIDNVDNVGAYVVKYMNKELNDKRLIGYDLYGRSRGLKEPIILKYPQEVTTLLEETKNKIVYSKSYDTEYRGKVDYCQVNLSRL